MKNLLGLILVFCTLGTLSVEATNEERVKSKNKVILLVNTYHEAAPWSNSIIMPVLKEVSMIPGVDAYVEHMTMLMMTDESSLDLYVGNLFKKYSGDLKPDYFIAVGNAAFSFRERIKEEWGDIPIIVCGENLRMLPDTAYFSRKNNISTLPYKPISEMKDDYNVTVLRAPVYVENTVDMMAQVIPGMHKLLFCADSLYSNRIVEANLLKHLQEKYPGMEYERVTAGQIETKDLFDKLYNIDNKTGVLFSTWFYLTTNMYGREVLKISDYRLISYLNVPLFSLYESYIEEGDMVGGYYYDADAYIKRLLSVLHQVTKGKAPRDIPVYDPDSHVVLDYAAMKRKNLSVDNAPIGTVFINRPPTFWEKYRVALMIFASIFISAIWVMLLIMRIRILTKTRDADEREREQYKKYMNLINSMPILYSREKVTVDENGKFVTSVCEDVNKAFEKIFWKREELIGRSATEFFKEAREELIYFMQIVVTEHRSVSFSYYFKDKDIIFDILVTNTSQSGVLDIFAVNTTELHRTQRLLDDTNHKLSMALEVANVVPWKWNLVDKTILCDVNRPLELTKSSLEAVDEDQLTVPESEYFAKIHKDDRERVSQAYRNLIEGKTEKVKEEYRVVSRGRSGYRIDWIEAQAVVDCRDKDGKPLTLIGSSLNITERKNMEKDLVSAKDRAEESNRLKSAFLANMSHEIRTPLNAIVGFSGILASTQEENEKQEYVSIIENNNNLLLQLISDILDLSKIEAGTLEFVYTDIDLNDTMSALENSMRLRLHTDQVELCFVPGMKDCYVNTEKNRVSQLIINLLTNAIKFTKEGRITFGYELRGDQLYFYVADTGCGIREDKIDKVFEHFVKLDNFAQGTGLGLSICQTIVQTMGGEIGVDSKEGVGSTFWFTIPYVPAKAQLKAESLHPQITVKKDRLTILIAEDNDSNYRLFNSVLRNDYNLLHAWNGKEAVEMYAEHRPHIILMDINMPVMDGYEAAAEIRKHSTEVPIIAVTAFAYASDEQRVLENGFDGYMAKPINSSKLKKEVSDLLSRRFTLL